MNVKELIRVLGGAKALADETGKSISRISQWGTNNYIPAPIAFVLRERHPDAIDWAALEMAPSANDGRAARAQRRKAARDKRVKVLQKKIEALQA